MLVFTELLKLLINFKKNKTIKNRKTLYKIIKHTFINIYEKVKKDSKNSVNEIV